LVHPSAATAAGGGRRWRLACDHPLP
jgi:hypothetical protein